MDSLEGWSIRAHVKKLHSVLRVSCFVCFLVLFWFFNLTTFDSFIINLTDRVGHTGSPCLCAHARKHFGQESFQQELQS